MDTERNCVFSETFVLCFECSIGIYYSKKLLSIEKNALNVSKILKNHHYIQAYQIFTRTAFFFFGPSNHYLLHAFFTMNRFKINNSYTLYMDNII